MEQLISSSLNTAHNAVSSLGLLAFVIVLLFGLSGRDGVPVAKALLEGIFKITLALLKLLAALIVWSFRVLLNCLTLAVPGSQAILDHLFDQGGKAATPGHGKRS